MKRNNLLFIMLLIGLVLIGYSWWHSWPLTVESIDDVVFNHVSPLYWLGLAISLGSMLAISFTSQSRRVKWLLAVGFVLATYSLLFFYFTLPGADSQAFRGLTEYFIQTGDLNPSLQTHSYFQWPSFFILSDIATSISGLSLLNFEFLLFGIMCTIYASALYVYGTSSFKQAGFAAVAAFFVGMFFFLNFQGVPYTLAFGLLLLLFMLETRTANRNLLIIQLVIYVGITFTHPFAPLFFVLYLLVRFLISRERKYLGLAFLTSTIFLVVQVVRAWDSFIRNIVVVLFTPPDDFSLIVANSFAPISHPVDQVAQMFSRSVTIAVIGFCILGFFLMLIKGKLRSTDKAILVTGVVYSVIGVVLYTIGSRAYSLVFIPLSLGVPYLLGSRFKRFVKPVFLLLIILFVAVPLHNSFPSSEVGYQTEEAYRTENFLIDHYNWTKESVLLSHFRAMQYIQTKYYVQNRQSSPALFEHDIYSPTFPSMEEYDCILYTLGLGSNLLTYNYTLNSIAQSEQFNMVFSSGLSNILIKSNFNKTG